MSAHEIALQDDDFIVSKTDPKGRITYYNRIFMDIAGYQESELLGQPHNIIRHPDMPRAVFRLLWKTLQQGDEFFGLIKNRCKNDDYYWTFANVTPSLDQHGQLLGYYSVRRKPKASSIATITTLYQQMCQQEASTSNAKQSMDAAEKTLMDTVQSAGQSYNEFIITLEK